MNYKKSPCDSGEFPDARLARLFVSGLPLLFQSTLCCFPLSEMVSPSGMVTVGGSGGVVARPLALSLLDGGGSRAIGVCSGGR